MANYYCDTGLTSGSNNGTSFDNAWQSLKTALENAFSAGDVLWVRRRSSFASASANIATSGSADGTWLNPIRIIGWPRASVAISSSDWTNGSTSVVIDDGGMDRERHQGRYITGPDSQVYLITKVTDANNIVIDREYAGSTASNAAATISADEDYDEAQAIDDSSWTIKKTDWNGDAHDLPSIDFEATNYQLIMNGSNNWRFANIEFKNGANSNGTVYCYSGFGVAFIGCLFKQSNNAVLLQSSYSQTAYAKRCIFEGSGSGSTQRGFYAYSARLVDCAIYNFGDYGLNISSGGCLLENVNIGVEAANGNYDISDPAMANVVGIDVKCGGTNGIFAGTHYDVGLSIGNAYMENFGKVLGAHRIYNAGTMDYTQRVAVVAGSGDPEKRSGGSDSVLAIVRTNYNYGAKRLDWSSRVAEFRIWADTSSKSYRLYCQLKNVTSLSASQLLLRCTYVAEYDDTTEYMMKTVDSDETVSQRSSASDWSQYIEVTGIQPVVAGWVILRVYGQWYDTDGVLYIDPKVVIS